MSITDELRAWAKGSTLSSWTAEHLTAIADRIDAEHESACAEAYGNGVMSVPISLDESAWVELPKDADGEYIHVGDVMEWVRYEDDDPTIVRKVSAVGADVFFAWSDEQGRYAQYEAHAYRHHHKPTVEDVLRDYASRILMAGCIDEEDELVDKYAAKLRLAEEVDA